MRPMTVERQTSENPSSAATSLQSLQLPVTVTSRRKRQFPWFVGISVLASLLILVATSLWFIILLQDARGPGFSQGRAIKFAHLAGAAYCSEDAVSRWKCGDHCIRDVRAINICNGNLTSAYVGIWQSKSIVAFRGYRQTETLVREWRSLTKNVYFDNETCAKCKVNSQVLEEWRSLEPCIEDSLEANRQATGDEIRVTGHGFGAALSAVALLALSKNWKIDESYNFGMPRTGNKHFARAIRDSFPQRVFRVTHHQDPMVQVPPLSVHYSHLEPEWFYDYEVFKGFRRCSKDSPARCSGPYKDVDEDLRHMGDHWKYMDLNILTCSSEVSNRFFAPLTKNEDWWTEQTV